MPSSIAVNPTTALLLAPLISSSCSLWFAWDQHYFLHLFTLPELRQRGSNAILPAYFKAFFNRGLVRVVGLLGVTTWASVGAIYIARPLLERRGSLPWYIATAALAVGHLAYIPGVIPPIKKLVEAADLSEEEEEEEDEEDGSANVETLRGWLRVNMTRLWTTDLGAWACCVVAVAKTFSVDE